MNSHEYDAIMTAIESIRDTNKEAHDDIRSLIDGGLKGYSVQLDTEMKLVNEHLLQLTLRADKANGTVADLVKADQETKKVLEDFRKLRRKIDWHKKNWYFVMLGIILFIVTITFLYDIGMVSKGLEWIVEKIFT